MTTSELTEERFKQLIAGTSEDVPGWGAGRTPELLKIFSVLLSAREKVSGPTLDVASGGGALYGPIKYLMPNLLPYAITELKQNDFYYQGELLTCYPFECEKERLPLPDQSQGLILFCDVLEHLIVDPVWTLLEFNRVLKIGGHLLISTPNAASADRITKILLGYNPASESEYKPNSIYQRHNREWTVRELTGLLKGLGFNDLHFTTDHIAVDEALMSVVKIFRQAGFTTLEDIYFGPQIILIGEKKEHLTIDSPPPDDRRWPTWLYTEYENYRRRPKVFPIVTADDFA